MTAARKKGPTKAELEAIARQAMIERVRASVEEGRGKSMFEGAERHGPMCRCGVPRKPPGTAKYLDDDGLCPVHPDQPPQRWVRGADREVVDLSPAGPDAVAPG